MGIFYDDKKILASSWLLGYLSKNHCHKVTSTIPEYNGYRGDIIKISSLSTKTKVYDNETLGKAADILFANGHIEFQSKDLRKREDSDIYSLGDGRQAVKSSFYIKIFIKKWLKRGLILLGAIGTAILIFLNSKNVLSMKIKS